jgi:MFS family permease
MIAWLPVPELIARFNADDAYYYLTIARNVASGQGVTFDGLAPTNGFHPLYLALLLAFFWFTSGALDLNVHLALTLLSIVNVLTALPLYTIVERTMNVRAAWVAVVAWLFNPWVMAITLLGVESALYVFVLAWTLERYVDWQIVPKRRTLVVVGILAGLTILARTDGIFLALALAFDLLWRSWRKDWHPLVIFGVIVALVLAPWLVWNWLNFGTIVQTSGAAILYAQLYDSPITPSSVWASVNAFSLTIALVMFQGLVFALVVLFVSIVLRKVSATWINSAEEWLPPRQVLLMYVLLWFAFYAMYFRHSQLWYFLPIIFIATIGVSGLYARLPRLQLRSERAWYAGVLAFYVISFIVSLWFWASYHLAFYPAQANGYKIARWVSEHTEPTARIGTWNAGVVGYFSTRSIINLDGVVNNELYRYVSERQLTFRLHDLRDYITRRQIDYVTDYELLCAQDIEDVSWLAPVFEFPSVFGACTVRMYQVIRER